MPTIQGPITFEKGKEIPQGVKDFIKDNGCKMPFDFDQDFTYTNTAIDNWFRVNRTGKGRWKMDRPITKKLIKE